MVVGIVVRMLVVVVPVMVILIVMLIAMLVVMLMVVMGKMDRDRCCRRNRGDQSNLRLATKDSG